MRKLFFYSILLSITPLVISNCDLFAPPRQWPEAYYWNTRVIEGSATLHAIASSWDGTRLAACDFNGYIHTSPDGGATWIRQTNSGARAWISIASSSDGTRLAAAHTFGYIYCSSDSGLNWTAQETAGNRQWWSIISSTDGRSLLALAAEGGGLHSGSYITYSSSWGWVGPIGGQTLNTDGGLVSAIASGDFLVQAVCSTEGEVYICNNNNYPLGGWERTIESAIAWRSVASSLDGVRMAAGASNEPIFTSENMGGTWIRRTNSGARNWRAIASSGDGRILAAVVYGGYIYLSRDFGETWTQQTDAGLHSWVSIAMSTDGSRLAAVADSEYVFTALYR